MKDFDWNEFKRDKIAVHCDTEEKAKDFLSKYIKNGINKWSSGHDITTDKTYYDKYCECTCYSCCNEYGDEDYFGFSSRDWHKQKGYKIIEWQLDNIEGNNRMELNELKTKLQELETNTNKSIADLKAEIKKKESEIKAEKIEKVWKPKDGDVYYWIFSSGDIDSDEWDNDTIDNTYYTIGNCFKTEELATKERDKRILLTELERWALEHNEEEIDWNDDNQCKYVIQYSNKYKELEIDTYRYTQASQLPHFTSEELAKEAIKIFGDRLKGLVFNK